MKNLYNVSAGQMAVLWVAGIVAILVIQDQRDPGTMGGLLILAIIAGLLFYTMGWRRYSLEEKKKTQLQKPPEAK